jgi:hypothetical protein
MASLNHLDKVVKNILSERGAMPVADTMPEPQPKGLRSYKGGRPKGVRNRRRDDAPDAVMLRIPDAARRYAISETKLKRWIKDNEVESYKTDNIRLIRVASLERRITSGV